MVKNSWVNSISVNNVAPIERAFFGKGRVTVRVSRIGVMNPLLTSEPWVRVEEAFVIPGDA